MDTPLAATVHKENVHIGGGKATFTVKPDKLKQAKVAGKERKALADVRSTHVDLKQKSALKGTKITKGAANLNPAFLSNVGEGNAHFGHAMTDAEIIEEMGCHVWSAKDEENLLRIRTVSELMASSTGIPISELEQPLLSDEEGYVSDDWPCCLSSVFTSKELDDPLGVAGLVLEEDEYTLPDLKLDDDFE